MSSAWIKPEKKFPNFVNILVNLTPWIIHNYTHVDIENFNFSFSFVFTKATQNCVCVWLFLCLLDYKISYNICLAPPSYYPPSPLFLKQLKYGLVRRAAPCQNARKIAAKLCFCYARKERLKKNFNILCLVLMELFWMINIGLCKWLNSLQHIFRCKKFKQ